MSEQEAGMLQAVAGSTTPEQVVAEIQRIKDIEPLPVMPPEVADTELDPEAVWGLAITLNRAVMLYSAVVTGGAMAVGRWHRARWAYRFGLAASVAVNVGWLWTR